MTKFEGWVQGCSASSLAVEDPCPFHVLFGDSVEFNFEEGWACSSVAPSLATEVPCAYPVVSEELTENGWVEYVWAMLVGHVTGGCFVFLFRFQLVHLAAFGCWMFGVAPSVSLPCLGSDRWWKHPLVFQLFEFAAMPFSSFLLTKGKMLGKGWTGLLSKVFGLLLQSSGGYRRLRGSCNRVPLWVQPLLKQYFGSVRSTSVSH